MQYQDNITLEEANEAGLTIEDAERSLAQWNYDTPASAKIAYFNVGIEKLQLLRQIKYLLSDNKLINIRKTIGDNPHKYIGISTLYDALEESRGVDVRKIVAEEGGKLQSWSALGSSKVLSSFVKKHEIFFGGFLKDGKIWYPASSNDSPSINNKSNKINKNWSDEELYVSVKTYVEMQTKEASGQHVIKSNYYKLLAEKYDRTEKAFEYRMQNISYVLQLMDKKWLTGLKPAKNVGTTNAGKIEEYLLQEYQEKSHKSVAFEIEWREALRDTKKDNSKIPLGNANPSVIVSESTQYCRDPKVKAWVLENANGKCECCHKESPFMTFDAIPYLEVHHIIRLADGGPDTISNAVAVCPNCHRELHYGIKSKELITYLYKSIKRLIA